MLIVARMHSLLLVMKALLSTMMMVILWMKYMIPNVPC